MKIISPAQKSSYIIFGNFMSAVNRNGELVTCDWLTNSELVTWRVYRVTSSVAPGGCTSAFQPPMVKIASVLAG